MYRKREKGVDCREMTRYWLVGMAALLSFAAVVSGRGELWKGENVKTVQISGKVLCQDCSQGWNQWAHGATPLKGSKVAVTCLDSRRRAVYHGFDETDEKGNFNLPVDLHRHSGDSSKDIRPEGCSVRLVSSPDNACNVMTDFGGGRSGSRLVRPSNVYPGRLGYTVGPFFFTSPMCNEPDTNGE